MKKSFKLIGGLILALVLVTAAQAAVVTVSCNTTNSPANPILNSSNANLATGAFVQVIDNTSGTVSAPLASTGLPTANGTVVATGTLSAAGVFTKSGVSIPNGHYVYIVAWDSWNGTGTPTGNYGISTISAAMSGVSFIYKPASFATNNPITPFNYTLSVAPTSGTVQQGNSTSPLVTATLTSGSTTPITLSASGQPSGVTVSFSANPISPTATSTVTIAVGSSVAAGTYPITINGTGGKTATYNLTVSTTPVTNPTISSITWKTDTPDNTKNQNYVYGTITINGTNFGADPGDGSRSTAANHVTIGGVTVNDIVDQPPPADNGIQVYSWSATKIECGVPLGVVANGNVPVIVTAGSVASNASNILVKPKVYSVAPLIGPVGTVVTITGTGFNATAASNGVSFNGSINVGASSFAQMASNETLTVSVPNGATTGQLLVNVNAQSSNTNYDWAPFDQIVFTVSTATLTSIAVTPINPTINAGGSQQFTAIGTYSDSSTQNITSQVTWASGTPAVATINSSGLASGVAAGTTNITASLNGKTSPVQILTVTAPGQPIVTGISPNSGTVGTSLSVTITGANTNWSGAQTLTFSNSGITVNGAASATSATTISANISIAAGAATGAGIVTVNGTNGSATFTVNPVGPTPTAIIIDDFEGGCVGKWATQADGGYYTFQNGMMTPDNDHITPNGPDPSAAKNGALGMKVKFSYVKNADSTKDWGDGWGAQLHKVLDLSPMKSVTMNIRWDGSANAVKFGFQDAAGHVYVANIPNSALMAVSGYGPISIPVSSFAEDTTNKSRVAGAIDWAHITNYNFAYLNQGTTTAYQYIDDITALTTSEPNPINAPVINSITPNSAPTGTLITVVGLNFSPVQGMSTLTFTNTVTNVLYQASVISWSDTMIQAQVPQLATIGTYEVMVNKMAVSQGVVTVQQSNQSAFQVTAQSGGLATIYPNPFNPNSQVVNIIFTQPAGATNIGVYYYDMTARLVKKDMLYSVSQTTWDGKNQNGAVVGDGVYLLRIVNEDTKSLIAKGKILVVKH